MSVRPEKDRYTGGMPQFYPKQGFRRFASGRFKEAVFSFEKAIGHTKSYDEYCFKGVEKLLSYLGQAYLKLGENDKAVKRLSEAYRFFHEMDKGIVEDQQEEELKKMLRAYSEALSKVGETEKAEEIAREADEIQQQRV